MNKKIKSALVTLASLALATGVVFAAYKFFETTRTITVNEALDATVAFDGGDRELYVGETISGTVTVTNSSSVWQSATIVGVLSDDILESANTTLFDGGITVSIKGDTAYTKDFSITVARGAELSGKHALIVTTLEEAVTFTVTRED